MSEALDFSPLKEWFLCEQRDLPWRKTRDPYAVWISEVMLQQTQVAVVISYFERWMSLFPTVQALAAAPLEQVIKCWEGLGYYSRARNLHAAAHYLVSHFQGQIPPVEEELQKIKGLGPYTIGAILSFAFHQKKAAVDGNVIRVLARLFALHDDVSKEKTVRKLRQLLQSLLPEEESWIVNEGLIELGATICQKKPKCLLCPLKKQCKAFREGVQETLPVKLKKIATTYLFRAVPILYCEGSYLLQKGTHGKVMSDLYEFPYFELSSASITPKEMVEKTENFISTKVHFKHLLPKVSHSFTRYQVSLLPFLLEVEQKVAIEGYVWVDEKVLETLPFSSGHRRILQQLH